MISAIGKKGFSLLELIFVIAIISIVAMVSFASLRGVFDTLQLNNTAEDIQAFINYLSQRSVIEEEVISLEFRLEERVIWAVRSNDGVKLNKIVIPKDVRIETDKERVLILPDGTLENVTLKLTGKNNRSLALTTKGVLAGVRIMDED